MTCKILTSAKAPRMYKTIRIRDVSAESPTVPRDYYIYVWDIAVLQDITLLCIELNWEILLCVAESIILYLQQLQCVAQHCGDSDERFPDDTCSLLTQDECFSSKW